jgi:ketosteroid isomerase-like protein
VAGAASSPETAKAQAGKGLDPRTEAIIREHYKAWDQKDWPTENRLLADDFTFSSPAGDDHISKSLFKMRCWDTQAAHIKRFDLLRIFGDGNEAFVMYDCLTTNDKTFRNVEYFQVANGKVAALVCYFGAPSNYPTEVSAGRT